MKPARLALRRIDHALRMRRAAILRAVRHARMARFDYHGTAFAAVHTDAEGKWRVTTFYDELTPTGHMNANNRREALRLAIPGTLRFEVIA